MSVPFAVNAAGMIYRMRRNYTPYLIETSRLSFICVVNLRIMSIAVLTCLALGLHRANSNFPVISFIDPNLGPGKPGYQTPVILRSRTASCVADQTLVLSESTNFLPPRCDLNCPKCCSDEVVSVPAEVRLFRNPVRTMSHPPLSPAPDIRVCLDCGWSEFSIPNNWLSADWLGSLRKQRATVNVTPIRPIRVAS